MEETKNKEKFWKRFSAVLAVLLIISVVFLIRGYSQGGMDSITGFVTAEDAKTKVETYVNTLLAGQAIAEVGAIEESNGLWKLELIVDGQKLDSYLTADGKILFPNAINLDEEPKVNSPPEVTAPVVNVDMNKLLDDDAVKGDANAPVTIIEWGDFECPFCSKFYSQTLGQIDTEYIQTGKVKLIYRDFPLDFHENAQKAAEAAECAGEQDKYYDMHDMLFEKGVVGGVHTFKGYASDLGLDTEEFNDCLDSGKMAAEVAKDLADGQAAGITGTPGFLVNGKLISGAQPFSVFKQIIDEELSN